MKLSGMPNYVIPLKPREIPQNYKKSMIRMGLEGMDKRVENTEKLATGLQHIVNRTTADSVLLASCVAVSF